MKKTTIKVYNRGSFTVEAALIFPMIFLIIAALIFLCMMLYQQVYMKAAIDYAANRGAAIWSNPLKGIDDGAVNKKDLGKGGLYWQIYDFHKEDKKSSLKAYLKGTSTKSSYINKYNIINPSSQDISVDLEDFIVYKKLEITAVSKYKMPFGGILKLFGSDGYYTIKSEANAVLNEPVEFIRNTDFILDVERELEEKHPDLKKAGDSVRGIMNDVLKGVSKFFDGQ
jgi:hypothetical protein